MAINVAAAKAVLADEEALAKLLASLNDAQAAEFAASAHALNTKAVHAKFVDAVETVDPEAEDAAAKVQDYAQALMDAAEQFEIALIQARKFQAFTPGQSRGKFELKSIQLASGRRIKASVIGDEHVA